MHSLLFLVIAGLAALPLGLPSPQSDAQALSSGPSSVALIVTGANNSDLPARGNPYGITYVTNHLGQPLAAINLTAGSYLGTSESGSVDASFMPTVFDGATAAAWFKCDPAQQPVGSAGTIFEWGLPGSYYAVGQRKFSLLTSLPMTATYSTIAGGYAPVDDSTYCKDGVGQQAAVNYVMGMAYVGQNLYLADMLNCQIRQLTPSGSLTTLAGYPPKNPADGFQNGYIDGVGLSAKFWGPFAIVADPGGSGQMYVTDFSSQCVRKVHASTAVVGTVAGKCIGRINLYTVQAFPAATTQVDGTGSSAIFVAPSGLAINPAGTILYVMDECTIRKVVIATGAVTTFAGGACADLVDGVGTAARFGRPTTITGTNVNVPRGAHLATDGVGTIYVVSGFWSRRDSTHSSR